jgi:hypothetical protein
LPICRTFQIKGLTLFKQSQFSCWAVDIFKRSVEQLRFKQMNFEQMTPPHACHISINIVCRHWLNIPPLKIFFFSGGGGNCRNTLKDANLFWSETAKSLRNICRRHSRYLNIGNTYRFHVEEFSRGTFRGF